MASRRMNEAEVRLEVERDLDELVALKTRHEPDELHEGLVMAGAHKLVRITPSILCLLNSLHPVLIPDTAITNAFSEGARTKQMISILGSMALFLIINFIAALAALQFLQGDLTADDNMISQQIYMSFLAMYRIFSSDN